MLDDILNFPIAEKLLLDSSFNFSILYVVHSIVVAKGVITSYAM